MLVANKIDLPKDKWEISLEEANDFATEKGNY